jgi:hypothetical protein
MSLWSFPLFESSQGFISCEAHLRLGVARSASGRHAPHRGRVVAVFSTIQSILEWPCGHLSSKADGKDEHGDGRFEHAIQDQPSLSTGSSPSKIADETVGGGEPAQVGYGLQVPDDDAAVHAGEVWHNKWASRRTRLPSDGRCLIGRHSCSGRLGQHGAGASRHDGRPYGAHSWRIQWTSGLTPFFKPCST